jgi:hypothetical protein
VHGNAAFVVAHFDRIAGSYLRIGRRAWVRIPGAIEEPLAASLVSIGGPRSSQIPSADAHGRIEVIRVLARMNAAPPEVLRCDARRRVRLLTRPTPSAPPARGRSPRGNGCPSQALAPARRTHA